MKRSVLFLAILALFISATMAFADEGMWPYNLVPKDKIKAKYGVDLTPQFLDHLRLASVRTGGGSASFVSPDGLVFTNHHVGAGCVHNLSTKDKDYIMDGFYAATRAEEAKCPGIEFTSLLEIKDITKDVQDAAKGLNDAEAAAAQRQVMSKLEKDCADPSRNIRCETITLYSGGMHHLYKYKKYTDVRLVMAPEADIAFFGGDPDNFTYPRYDLDLTLLRVYENGQPYAPTDYLRWSAAGAVEDELVFVVGNPGSTGRLNTIAQMEYLRDVGYPASLAAYKRALGIYSELERTDTSAARRYQNDVFGIANSQKAVTGYRAGLLDTASMAKKRAFEQELRARIAADPKLQAQYGASFDAIANAQRELGTFNPQLRYYGFGGGSNLMQLAAGLVRVGLFANAPDSARLPQYRGVGLENIKRQIVAPTPIDTAFERMAIAAQLRAAQSELPANDPFLSLALSGQTPEARAAALVRGTRITDPAFRQQLVQGGAAAITGSTDPMIVLARQIDPFNRTQLARANALNAIIAANSEKIGQALFATYGTALPPDATFTLR